MSTGSFGCWAMAAGDFVAREFPGTPTGVAEAIAHAGANGVVQVYPGSSGLLVPALPAGVRVIRHEGGLVYEYGRGGLKRDVVYATDYATVQAAVDTLDDFYGGVVVLPPGQLDSSSTPAFTGATLGPSQCLVGAQGLGTVLKQDSPNLDAIVMAGSYAGLYDVQVRGANAAGSGHGIHFTSGGGAYRQHCTLSRVIVTQTPQWGVYIDPTSAGVGTSGIHADHVVIDQNVATNAGSLFIGQGSDNNDFYFCQFNGINSTGTYNAFGGPTIEQGVVHIELAGQERFWGCRWEKGGSGAHFSIKATTWDIQLRGIHWEPPEVGTRGYFMTCAGGVNGLLIDGLNINSHSTVVGPRIFKSTTNSDVKRGVLRNVIGQTACTSVQTDDVVLGNVLDEMHIEDAEIYYNNGAIAAYKPIAVSGAGAALPIIASASTITIPPREAETFAVSGTTAITSITAARAGREVTLIFTSTAQVTDGSNILLNGSANFTGGANRVLHLVCDGTNWLERSRASN